MKNDALEIKNGKYLYAWIMYLLGDCDTAKEILEEYRDILENEFVLSTLISICVETGCYEEAYGYCMELEKSKIPAKFLRRVRDYEAFLESKLLIAPTYNNRSTYFEQQLDLYDEESARCIVRKNYKNLKKYNTCFAENIDINKLFVKVKKSLESTKRYGRSESPMDVYFFDYPNIGMYKGRKANALKVVTIIKTHKILTMYPICARGEIELLQLDTLDEYHHDKVKCLSGLERFNNRYKNNKFTQ